MFSRFCQVMFFVAATPVAAQSSADARILFDTLRQPQLIEILAREGRDAGEEIMLDLAPDKTPALWQGRLAALYDADKMETVVFDSFSQRIEEADVDAILAFYQSALGQQTLDAELRTRADMAAPATEEALRAAADQALSSRRYQDIQRFISVNDLVEENVAYTLSDNVEFYKGVIAGGGAGDDFTEANAVSAVWSEEEIIRADITQWLTAYFLAAYADLTDQQMEAMIVFAQSDAGADLSRALLDAYAPLYRDLSRASGLLVAEMMTASEL